MKELSIDKFDSPVGEISLVFEVETLCALDFQDYEARMLKLLQKRYGTVHLVPQRRSEMRDRLTAYLAGDFTSLDSVSVSTGGTLFQQQVWQALRFIPAGTVLTYRELALRVGKPTACRAVGMANSLNPVSIVLPCHRVIGANASLTGYAGGLERKRWLLQHEGVHL
ncbi:methylated-DNA--[protein]-cysteine S-methyltransferase [Phormidium tenue FACHB-886]|nr:methylated-DNA--[protein]-cysteine S-methyltransferase [Phormidium tenue FACHB-886]